LQNELKGNRISDPENLVPLLDKIQANQQIMNYARAEAGKIKQEIQTKK